MMPIIIIKICQQCKAEREMSRSKWLQKKIIMIVIIGIKTNTNKVFNDEKKNDGILVVLLDLDTFLT